MHEPALRIPEMQRKNSVCGGLFHLLDVVFFDLLHHGFSFEEIGFEVAGDLAGNDEKLIVDHFAERNRAASGNQMRAPLKHESEIPENKTKKKRGGRGKRGTGFAEKSGGPFQKDTQAQNKDGGERKEKAVSKGRNAGPIGIAGD